MAANGAAANAGRPKVVVLGMMTKMPVAGVVWQNLHYLLGLERLGCEAYYVETHARTPSMLMSNEDDDSSALAAEFIAAVMRRFGLADRWAFHALHDDGRCFGMSEHQLSRLYGSAELLINLHGGTQPLPELSANGRLIYVETDPVQLQLELHHGVQETVDFLEPHSAFFTFAENWGKPDCGLPVQDRFRFIPTRQPVVLDLWPDCSPQPADVFTTIGNWRQAWRRHLRRRALHLEQAPRVSQVPGAARAQWPGLRAGAEQLSAGGAADAGRARLAPARRPRGLARDR
jgi:hypothetical protein